MVDLSTSYMGLSLKCPMVAGASPLSSDVSTIRQIEDHGAAAVVLHSLFEEQIHFEAAELDHHLTHGTESFAEATSYFPDSGDYRLGPDEYLTHVSKAKEAVSIPVIASLNGVSVGGWTEHAKLMEQAGADAIELNVFFFASDPAVPGQDVEQRYLDILKAVKGCVSIPVAMKLSPYFSSMASMAKRLDEAGADGLVLFNRFYQPDIDLESLTVGPNLVLSTSHEMRLPLNWIGVLYGRLTADLASSSGVATGTDVLKLVMAGADATQIVSALLKNGVEELNVMRTEICEWMEEHEYESIEQMKGSMSARSIADPAAFERANYMKTLNSYV
jgi:dihydroorotate dehydrogenase (fumarate)